jgi:hypothetical protein
MENLHKKSIYHVNRLFSIYFLKKELFASIINNFNVPPAARGALFEKYCPPWTPPQKLFIRGCSNSW